jgi:hypothetical protein
MRAVQSACPEAKLLIYFAFDGVDWHQIDSSQATGYASSKDRAFELTIGPGSENPNTYDIDAFVESFDRWTSLDEVI